eukprot:310490_1
MAKKQKKNNRLLSAIFVKKRQQKVLFLLIVISLFVWQLVWVKNTNTADLETIVTLHAQNKHIEDTSNGTKCRIDQDPNGKYKIINGIVIPTVQQKKNWRSYGFEVNCSHKVSDYINKNVATINYTMWRGDGVGEQLKETMKFIAISLLNPSKYHYYYFPFLFRSEFWTNKCR